VSEEEVGRALSLDALDELADRLRAAIDRDDRDEVDCLVRKVPEDELHNVWLRVVRRPNEPREPIHRDHRAESA
jgi:hypothetical protein